MYARSKIWTAAMAFGGADLVGQNSRRTRLRAADRGESGEWAPVHSRDQEVAHAEVDPAVEQR